MSVMHLNPKQNIGGVISPFGPSSDSGVWSLKQRMDWRYQNVGPAYWPQWRDHINKVVKSNSPDDFNESYVHFPPVAFYCQGGVLLPDGRVFAADWGGKTTGTVFDPATNTVSNTAAVLGSGYRGSVLMRNGKVFCVPYDTQNAAIWDPVTDTATFVTSPATMTSGRYAGGVLLPDGRVFCVPGRNWYAAIYDPVSGSFTADSYYFPSGFRKCSGGVLLPDGRVFCVPDFSASAVIRDVVANTATLVGGFPGTSNGFRGGVLMLDGRVLCIPSYAAAAYIYDPIQNTLTTSSAPGFGGGGAFGGGVLLPDGRVLCTAFLASSNRIYDPSTDTLTSVAMYTPRSAGGLVLPDGRIFVFPEGGYAWSYQPGCRPFNKTYLITAANRAV